MDYSVPEGCSPIKEFLYVEIIVYVYIGRSKREGGLGTWHAFNGLICPAVGKQHILHHMCSSLRRSEALHKSVRPQKVVRHRCALNNVNQPGGVAKSDWKGDIVACQVCIAPLLFIQMKRDDLNLLSITYFRLFHQYYDCLLHELSSCMHKSAIDLDNDHPLSHFFNCAGRGNGASSHSQTSEITIFTRIYCLAQLMITQVIDVHWVWQGQHCAICR